MADARNLAAASGGGIDWTGPDEEERRGLKRATYEDVLTAPKNNVAEILDGELVLSPRPVPRHALVSSELGMALGNPFHRGVGGPGGWWILDEPELHLEENVVVPDLAGWRRERLPTIPEEAFFSLAPDWVCEVLSPSTERFDRGRKLPVYAATGVAHAWLVKPAERMVEVLHLREGAWTIVGVFGDSDIVRIEPFEAIELELGRLWIDSPTRL
jgi:Uma2 family endonuclease